MHSKVCLILTGSTLQEDLGMFAFYQETSHSVDMLELRADHLNHNEIFQVYKFPSLVDVPVILTIRREKDGGEFRKGEYARLLTFFRCLNADTFETKCMAGRRFENANSPSFRGKSNKHSNFSNSAKTFAYIDLEDDFHIPELEDICTLLNIKIIRSHHSIRSPIQDYDVLVKNIQQQKYDIIKIASLAQSPSDTQKMFEAGERLKNEECILISLGKYGIVSRILATRLGSKWIYVLSQDAIEERRCEDEMLEAEDLVHGTYNFRKISEKSELFGIIGSSVNNALSLAYHNRFFAKHNMDCAYIPLSAQNIEEALTLAQYLEVKGLSVTAPFKVQAMQYADMIDESARLIGSCNTLTFFGEKFYNEVKAYNTDVAGFEKALKLFLKEELKPSLKVSVLGAGGAARAVCYVLYKLGIKQVVIFNRTHAKAQQLATQFNFESCILDASAIHALREHSALIINATSLGGLNSADKDVLPFYRFVGDERVFDLAYRNSAHFPQETPLLERAKSHGCITQNAYSMFHYQALEQIKIFYTNRYIL